jgi:hypothetical protein
MDGHLPVGFFVARALVWLLAPLLANVMHAHVQGFTASEKLRNPLA